MTPHPEKVRTGGADAFYISRDNCCMGLADGVGEWDALGFSPKSFADELMLAVQEVWEDVEHPIHKMRHLLAPSLIARELVKIAAKKTKTYGSATCCVSPFSLHTRTPTDTHTLTHTLLDLYLNSWTSGRRVR